MLYRVWTAQELHVLYTDFFFLCTFENLYRVWNGVATPRCTLFFWIFLNTTHTHNVPRLSGIATPRWTLFSARRCVLRPFFVYIVYFCLKFNFFFCALLRVVAFFGFFLKKMEFFGFTQNSKHQIDSFGLDRDSQM